MKDIKDYLLILNGHQCVISQSNIVEIVNVLVNALDVDINGIDFVRNDVYPMCYDFKDKKILIDYEFLINYYSKIARSSDLDYVSLLNYYIVFALIHELVHEKQRTYELNEDAKKIYDLCFKYVYSEDVNKLTALVRNMVYNRLHDYFAIEINANIVATDYLLGIVDKDYRGYFIRELYKIIKKCYVDYDLEDMYSDELQLDVSSFDFELPMYERIKLGLFIDGEDKNNLRKIRMERIVNCKSNNK